MVQPISLLMSHFNVEHSAQTSKDAIAPAQQTQQGQEVAQESIRRTQTVQANVAAAEQQKIRRKNDDENREKRREEQRSYSSESFEDKDSKPESEAVAGSSVGTSKTFDFYA